RRRCRRRSGRTPSTDLGRTGLDGLLPSDDLPAGAGLLAGGGVVAGEARLAVRAGRLVQERVVGPAPAEQADPIRELLDLEADVVEFERLHGGVGRYGIEPLLAPGSEQEQRVSLVELRDVPAWDRCWRHDEAAVDQQRVAGRAFQLAPCHNAFV